MIVAETIKNVLILITLLELIMPIRGSVVVLLLGKLSHGFQLPKFECFADCRGKRIAAAVVFSKITIPWPWN